MMENLTIQDMEAKAGDMQEIIASFAELLSEENQALEQFDVEKVGELFDRKAKTVAAYRSMTAFFIQNHEQLEQMQASKREKLKEATIRLNELIHQNEILLKTRMETSQSVMNTIINIAKVTNNVNATSYGAQGRYTPLDNNKNALSLNRTL